MVLDFLAVDNFDFTRKIVKKKLGEKLVKMLGFCQNRIFGQKFDFSSSFARNCKMRLFGMIFKHCDDKSCTWLIFILHRWSVRPYEVGVRYMNANQESQYLPSFLTSSPHYYFRRGLFWMDALELLWHNRQVAVN